MVASFRSSTTKAAGRIAGAIILRPVSEGSRVASNNDNDRPEAAVAWWRRGIEDLGER